MVSKTQQFGVCAWPLARLWPTEIILCVSVCGMGSTQLHAGGLLEMKMLSWGSHHCLTFCSDSYLIFFFLSWLHRSGSWPTSRLCHYVAAIKCWLCAKRRVVFHTSHCFVLYCRFPTQCLNKELLSVSFTPSCLFNKKTGEQTQAATRFNEFDGLIKHLWHTFAY